jgi:hypothetical protein
MSWKPKTLKLMSLDALLDEYLDSAATVTSKTRKDYHEAVRAEIIARFRLANGA